jgi:peptide/nickel transport system substrate-binding protein
MMSRYRTLSAIATALLMKTTVTPITETMRMKRLILPFTLVLLAACGGAGSQAATDTETIPEAERYGGTTVVSIHTDPRSLNTLVNADLEAAELQLSLLSLRLVQYDDNLEPAPLLAERWDTVRVAPDTLALTFHLRRDVRWHDGTPTTAEDVRFTYERMRDPQVGFGRNGFLDLWSPVAEVVDSFTIRFHLRAHTEFLDFWTYDVILPAHVLRDVPPEQLRHHAFGAHPIGNGPFRFVRYVPQQEWVFEANPDFPEALGGRPYLDRLVVRIVPDENTRFVELMRGALDLAGIRPAQVDQARAAGGVRLLTHKPTTYAFLAWNTRRPMFGDARVRRALGMAIDREGLVHGFLGGHGEVGRFTATPRHWQYDPMDPETLLPYDPEGAGRLLDEAGWRLRDDSGVRTDEQGRPLRFTLLAPHAVQTYTDILPAVQFQLRQLGADVQAQFLELSTMWDRVGGSLDANGERVRDFDALLFQWDEYVRLDNSYILHSRNRDHGFNTAGYANPRADWFMDTLAVTLDRETARPLWREYQRFMVQESPFTVLFYPYHTLAVRHRLQGVEFDAAGGLLASAPRWWIVPGARGRR